MTRVYRACCPQSSEFGQINKSRMGTRDATLPNEVCVDAGFCYTFSSGRRHGRRGRLCLLISV